MPAVPFGGLSFFLNIGIVIFGAILVFLEKKGFTFSLMHMFFEVITGKRFDQTWRRVLGYALMASITLFLFLSISVSFVNRMKVETNLDLLSQAIDKYYQANSSERLVAVNK